MRATLIRQKFASLASARPFATYLRVLLGVGITGAITSTAASPIQVTEPLTKYFPSETASLFNAFSDTNDLTKDATYKELYKSCRGYDNADPICLQNTAVFGTVNRNDANTSTRSMNRMIVLKPNGTRTIESVRITDGNIIYDRSRLRGNDLGIINLTYYRTSGSSSIPMLRCEAEIFVCGIESPNCPTPEPGHCVPAADPTNIHTTTTSSCACVGPNEGKVLKTCFQNVPTCVDPPTCGPGRMRMSDGSCKEEHKCEEYSTGLASICAGDFVTYTGSADKFPPKVTCEGTQVSGTCADTAGENCADMTLDVADAIQPANGQDPVTGKAGTLSVIAAGGVAPVTYSIQPNGPYQIPKPGTWGGLQPQLYEITAKDSGSPACTRKMRFNLTDANSTPGQGCTVTQGPTGNSCTSAAVTDNFCSTSTASFHDGCGNACPVGSGTKSTGCTPPTLAGNCDCYGNRARDGSVICDGTGSTTGGMYNCCIGTNGIGNSSTSFELDPSGTMCVEYSYTPTFVTNGPTSAPWGDYPRCHKRTPTGAGQPTCDACPTTYSVTISHTNSQPFGSASGTVVAAAKGFPGTGPVHYRLFRSGRYAWSSSTQNTSGVFNRLGSQQPGGISYRVEAYDTKGCVAKSNSIQMF